MADKHELDGRFWISSNGQYFAGKGRYELLLHIKETGSLSKAAKLMKMSYKAAWDSIKEMNIAAGERLVSSSIGGKKGGGTTLTEAGIKFLETYEKYNHIFDNAIKYMQDQSLLYDNSNNLFQSSNTSKYTYSSADNILNMIISDIKKEGSFTKLFLTSRDLSITLNLHKEPKLSLGDFVELSFNMAAVIVHNDIFDGCNVADLKQVEELPNFNIITLDIGSSITIKAIVDKSKHLSIGNALYFKIDPSQVIVTKF